MMPNILYPTSPAAMRKASAAGFEGSSFTPVTTTPKTAMNSKKRMMPVIRIPFREPRLMRPRFSVPTMPASMIRCAPEKVM